MQKALRALSFGFALACVGPRSLNAAGPVTSTPGTPCPTSAIDAVEVVDVDERLGLALADGRIVRLAGLEAPRATTQRPARPREVATGLLARLKGEPVTIAALGTKDRWGTTPVLAFVGSEDVALDLLGEGLTRFLPEPAVHACRVALLAAETKAREARRGVWVDPDLALLAAEVLAGEAQSSRTTGMIIVEGTVVTVGDTATRLFLNLGRSRGGFAISASKRNTALMGSQVMQGARIVGARLRIRGLLDDAAGLRMDLSDADALEVLPGASATGTSGR